VKPTASNAALIFDLDGTLWDASETSAEAWTQALTELNMHANGIDAAAIRRVSGLPFRGCVESLFPTITGTALNQLEDRLNHWERLLIPKRGGVLYPGVGEGLKTLTRSYRLFLVSNCQDWYLEAFLERFQVRHLFTDSESHGRTGKPKADNIRALIGRNDIKNAVYVGDTATDEAASASVGIPFVFMSYGFGSPTKPDMTFPTFDHLVRQFLT